MKAWRSLADQFDFIVACPDMVTATVGRNTKSKLSPAEEDDAVVLSIVRDVSEHFRVNRRAVMITGFSGGGNPSYHSALRHPDVFTHVCTRGGNFAPQQIPRDKGVIEAGKDKLQIYIFFGEQDHPLIVGEGGSPGQAQQAYDALQQAGYAHITFEEVAGMKHESRPRKAAAWFGAYLDENAKRFKRGDKVDEWIADAEEDLAEGKTSGALKSLLKARDAEVKYELEPYSQPLLDRLEAEGREALEAAREAEDRVALGKLARTYRGLPVAEDAKAALKALGT